MFGGKYIIQIGTETQKAATQGIYALVCRKLLETESEEIAGPLAAALSLHIWDDSPTDEGYAAFLKQNLSRIEKEIWAHYLHTDEIREVLSGAAYNIGYGRYVAAGGGRLFNKYLGCLRSERLIPRSLADSQAHFGLRSELTNLSPSILRPIESLKRFGLWRPRPDNPNEQAYYQATCAFARRQML